MTKSQIVIAWVDENEIIDPRTTKTRVVRTSRAAMWLNAGDERDLEAARRYASTEPGCRVFTYAPTEGDPLERARRDALKRDAG